jgi:hypothetical protein
MYYFPKAVAIGFKTDLISCYQVMITFTVGAGFARPKTFQKHIIPHNREHWTVDAFGRANPAPTGYDVQ